MTLEKLLGFSADDWEKLSDSELQEFCKKFHHITKPQKHPVEVVKSKKPKVNLEYQGQLKTIMALAEKLGIKK